MTSLGSAPPDADERHRYNCSYLDVSYVTEENGVFAVNVALIVVNVLLSVCATVLNTLVITAIRRNYSLHSLTNFLLCSLACSDLLTGLFAQSSFAASKLAEIHRNAPVFCLTFAVADFIAWTTIGASIMTLTIISVEKLISVQWPLRHPLLVTKKKLYVGVAFAWLLPLLFQCLRCWVLSREAITIIILVALVSCVAATTTAYCFVWKVLRRHQLQATDQLRLRRRLHGDEKVTREDIKKKTSVITMLYIYGLFLLSCIPASYSLYIFMKSGFQFVARSSNLWGISTTIAFVNSSVNPLVYCWRMKSIRQAIRSFLEKWLCRSNRVEAVELNASWTATRPRSSLTWWQRLARVKTAPGDSLGAGKSDIENRSHDIEDMAAGS